MSPDVGFSVRKAPAFGGGSPPELAGAELVLSAVSAAIGLRRPLCSRKENGGEEKGGDGRGKEGKGEKGMKRKGERREEEMIDPQKGRFGSATGFSLCDAKSDYF